ncbi:MAG TPA: FAD-dependent oxidoreductase [Rhodopila sp.]|uniref:NAD(P)/FAD-dependent oxidoreductase n=1 Tax=Rhodopila sp. TaxID=2480087 RepID=UPI002BAABC77|nr:FAD-dependent oxidoreductase [Rhodopila sp.]HVY17810.1 FAD-dependent oxidoreductase [Rhodopila sp.]
MAVSRDLIVVGGGLVGGAIAWGARQTGASAVLLDEGDIAFRAARGNFGLVWVQSKGAGMPPYAHWTRESARLWPHLAETLQAETGAPLGLHQPGGFAFCLSEQEFEERATLIRRMHNESGDIGTRMLDRAEVRAMVDGLGDEVVGASYCPVDGHASPLFLLRALHQGLDYRPNHRVERIDAAPNSFRVQCGSETFHAPRIVIAAGLGSRDLAPMVGLDMPVSPLQGQIIVTERMKPLLGYPTHTLRQTDEGSVMMGDSQEDVGFDLTTRVSVLKTIAERNARVFPALKDSNIVRMWAALRVMSPDGFPIYEESERFPGAFSATCHSGVTLAGAHALALAPAIMAGTLPESLAAFSTSRFRTEAAA